MNGLIVRQPFADLIASGEKVWELRRAPIRLKGRFYILAASSPARSPRGYPAGRLGVAVATAEQVDLVGPLTIDALTRAFRKHRASRNQLERYAAGGRLYAMELRATKLKQPRLYRFKPGAIVVNRGVELI